MPFAKLKVPADTLTPASKKKLIDAVTEAYGDVYGERARATTLVRVDEVVEGGSDLDNALTTEMIGAQHTTAIQPPDRPVAIPHLDGGLSDQAQAVAARSALARTTIQLYQPFETGDTAAYNRILTPDFADVPLAPNQGPGREGMVRHVLDDIVATFPDARFRIDAIHVSGNVVTVRGLFTGTQTAPFLGLPATNRQLQYRTVDIHQFAGMQIARTDHMEDFFSAYRQMSR
jgi:4-oxalocrotonate tautomerase